MILDRHRSRSAEALGDAMFQAEHIVWAAVLDSGQRPSPIHLNLDQQAAMAARRENADERDATHALAAPAPRAPIPSAALAQRCQGSEPTTLAIGEC
jgi:hypothetical protein